MTKRATKDRWTCAAARSRSAQKQALAHRRRARLEALDRDAHPLLAAIGKAERAVSRDILDVPAIGDSTGPLGNPDEAQDDVRMWSTHLWARRIRAAISKHNESADDEAAKIPSEASAYSLRHTRISELLQIHNIDPITVAQQTGTSVAMLEKTYFKFIPSAMRAKLASIKESAVSATGS